MDTVELVTREFCLAHCGSPGPRVSCVEEEWCCAACMASAGREFDSSDPDSQQCQGLSCTRQEEAAGEFITRWLERLHAPKCAPILPASLSPNAPRETNERGGKQSATDYDFTLLPPEALFRVAQVMYEAAKVYERDNWRKIACRDHLNHALAHILAHLAGDTRDDHMGHAATRMLMALTMHMTDDAKAV